MISLISLIKRLLNNFFTGRNLMDFFSPDDDIFDDEADQIAATIDSPPSGGRRFGRESSESSLGL